MSQRILICGLFGMLLWPSPVFAGSDPSPSPPAPGEGGRANPDLPFSRDLDIDKPVLPGLSDDFLKQQIPLEPIAPDLPEPSAPQAEGFVLQSIKLEGATLYSQAELKKLYRLFLGKYMSFDDLNKITRRIETFYTNNGWLTAKAVIPAQQIADGQLKINIFEGQLADIVVEGDVGNARGIIKAYLDDMKTGKPAKLADLETGLARLQDLQGLQVQSRLRAAESGKAGGVDLVVNVANRDLFSGSVSLNNIANESVGPWILSINSHFDSLALGGDRLALSVSNSVLNPDETLIGRMSYEIKIPKLTLGVSYDDLSGKNKDFDFTQNVYGTSVGIYVGGNWTRPDPQVSNTPTEDRGLTAGLYTRLPFYRSPILNMETRLEYDYSNRRTKSADDGSIQTEGDAHILSIGLNANYRSPWSSFTTFAAKIRQGLTEGGGPDLSNPRNNPAFGGINFTRRGTWLTGSFSHNQSLLQSRSVFSVPTPSLSFYVSATGQYAFRPLPNNERISFGGSSIGRGFDAGRISGDHGWGTSTELRMTWNQIGQFSFGKELGARTIFDSFTFYGFFDHAQIEHVVKNQLTENPMLMIGGRPAVSGAVFPTRNLFSAGFGVRAQLFGLLYAEATWAYALNNPFKKTPFLLSGTPSVEDLSDKGHSDFLLRLVYFL